jgi:transglutaminase-like putative cysteine protease
VRANARGIYDYVRAHMEYDKQTDGWGRGDTARACAVGKGNCSDYHSLFISIAQAKRIPARFHYGYSLKPGGEVGAHCWASFHTDEGWVPVDISEADKDPSRSDYFFGTLSENRVLVSTGRDLTLAPPQHAAPLNFLIDAYVEVDGQPLDPAAVAVTAKHTPAAAAP